MKTFTAIYRGNRVVELSEDVELPRDIEVLVVIPDQEPDQEDERELRNQLRIATEAVFTKLWDNKEDEIWNEYL